MTSLFKAATGTDPYTGADLSLSERLTEGAFGVFDLVSTVAIPLKALRVAVGGVQLGARLGSAAMRTWSEGRQLMKAERTIARAGELEARAMKAENAASRLGSMAGKEGKASQAASEVIESTGKNVDDYMAHKSSKLTDLLPEDPLIDNNTLVRIAANDPEAVKFATRRSGLLSVTPTIQQEFLNGGRTLNDFNHLANKYNIQILADATPMEIQTLASSLGITSPKRMNDLSLLAAAQKHGIGLVTGDKGLFSAALRSGYTKVEFRIFNHSPQARVDAYQWARDLVKQFLPKTSPHKFTGSGVGR
jgi:hypothetical protein